MELPTAAAAGQLAQVPDLNASRLADAATWRYGPRLYALTGNLV